MIAFERKSMIVELAILALTLVITSVTGYFIYYQTSRHFALQRTSDMIERFNRDELVRVRKVTDEWLRTKECTESLENCSKVLVDSWYIKNHELQEAEAENEESEKPSKKETIKSIKPPKPEEIFEDVRLYCNFFQELGTAVTNDTLDEKYMWDVFGYNVKRYGEKLKPFIEEVRKQEKRETLFKEVFYLIDKMKKLDEKYDKSSTPTKSLKTA